MKTLYDIAKEIAEDEEDYKKLMIVAKSVEHFLRTKMNALQPIIKLKSVGLIQLKAKYPKKMYENMRATMKSRGKKVWEKDVVRSEYYSYKTEGYNHRPFEERRKIFHYRQKVERERLERLEKEKLQKEEEELDLIVSPITEEYKEYTPQAELEDNDGIDRIF